MKTPSQYPVLDNRPIDQWKVTELKEELKRRKLMTKGLKDDLIKRLDEALRAEKEAEGQTDNGIDDPQPESADEQPESADEQPESADEAAKAEVHGVETGEVGTVVPADVHGSETGEAGTTIPVIVEETVSNDGGKSPNVDVVSVQEDGKDGLKLASQDERVEEKESELINHQSPRAEIVSAAEVPSADVGDEVFKDTMSETVTGELVLQDDKMESENKDEDLRAQQGSEDIKQSHVDVKLDSSDPNNQVSEVSTNLGFPIKSNSISTDSVSINEKNELEDNTIADNVKLEPDVKPEMVQPSSSALVPDGGESHPKDVEEPHENKVSVQETDNNVTNADLSQKNHSADLGSSEKLNLDRSSGDDSMEEDALESKQIDSNYNSEIGERTEKNEATAMKDESPSAPMASDLPAEEKIIPEKTNDEAAPSDKRKLPEQEVTPNNEPSKRLRRWKSENNKVSEPQSSNVPPAAAKDLLEPAAVKRTFSRSYSSGTNDMAKEREVPPSTKAATNSLRIDRFLRPFTLKAVQELLAKTGTVTSFWMDHIKTHCYVTYLCVEEAEATRNAVYNLQWPPNGGRHLVAEFVDPEEVKLRVDAPSQPPAATVSSGPTKAPEPPSTLPQPSPRLQNIKQRLSEQPTLPPPPPPPPLSNPASARERAQPPPPPPKEKVEAPIVTLDDLFRKTKATPRIYYLPLSEEQVSAILEERRKSSRQ